MVDQSDAQSHTILPIPDRQHVGLTTYDAKDPDTKFPPIEPLRPPKGAPNVLIVLLDDVGFSANAKKCHPCHRNKMSPMNPEGHRSGHPASPAIERRPRGFIDSEGEASLGPESS